jgi:RNA polymerase sigma-70 factor (ECF subfamily)
VSGKRAQFDVLFRKHYQEIFRYLSGQYPTMAEDLAQETFLALYDHLETVRPEATRAWLYRVAINKGADAMRSQQRRHRRHESAREAEQAIGVDTSETQVLVRLVLDKLKPREAQLLQLHSCGLSYGEMAEVLQLKPGSMSQLLFRAKQSFSLYYKQLQEE